MNIFFSALACSFSIVKAKDSINNEKKLVERFLHSTRKFLTIIFLTGSIAAIAQDDPQFSQNMYNRLPVNPAYAGSTGSMCATMLLRNQWVGFEGAPKSGNIAFDALVAPIHGGVGGTLIYDQIGFNKTIGLKFGYAYRMRVSSSGRLAFGLDGGVIQKTFNFDGARSAAGVLDPVLQGIEGSSYAPDFNFGIYFNTSEYYLGISTTHLNEGEFAFNSYSLKMRRHYYLMGGFNYALNRTLTFKPSVFAKSDVASTQIDANITVLYNNSIWAGVSYRIDDSVILMAGMNITNDLKFGYSYDITTSALNVDSKGSHELMLRYCFKVETRKPAFMNRNVRFL